MATKQAQQPMVVGARRVAILYVVLALATAASVIVAISEASSKHAEPQLAGGYDVLTSSACLGPQIELEQSGSFAKLSNALSTLNGSLRINDGRLDGTLHCITGNRAVARTCLGWPADRLARLDAGEGRAQARTAATGCAQAAGTGLRGRGISAGAKLELSRRGPDAEGIWLCDHSGYRQKKRGTLRYGAGQLTGKISCNHGDQRELSARASGRSLDIMLIAAAAPASRVASDGSAAAGGAAPAPGAEHLSATKQRTSDATVAAFFLAVIIVMLFARLCGNLMPRIGQPRVMGEVLAGILLGPTAFGAIDPGLQSAVFASDIVPYIGVAANLGLIFYMFLIGLEVDLSQLRGRVRNDAGGLQHCAADAVDGRAARCSAAVQTAGRRDAVSGLRAVRRESRCRSPLFPCSRGSSLSGGC